MPETEPTILPDIATPNGPEILEPKPAELPAIPDVPRPLTPDTARPQPDPTPAPPEEIAFDTA